MFDDVALDVIHGSLEGYNGTLFAYGQTGSGKTFTITGGPERYADRGIIPRTIAAVFSEVSQRSDQTFTVILYPRECDREISSLCRCTYHT